MNEINGVWSFQDAVVSIPGTGQYLQDIIAMNSRLNQGLLNLVQMKSILRYMTDIALIIEGATSQEE